MSNNKKQRRFTDSERARARELKSRGYTHVEMMDAMNLSYVSVVRICQELAGIHYVTRGNVSDPSPEWESWMSMHYRSTCKHGDYYNRGITICPRWTGPQGYNNFLSDMGRKPSPEYSIDRVDNDGNYTPENCRWATARQQNNNQRRSPQYNEPGWKIVDKEWVRTPVLVAGAQ